MSKCTEQQAIIADEQIIELYWQREEIAIQETNRKYGQFLFRIAYNILHDRCDCEECQNDPGHDLDNGYVCVMEYFESSYTYAFYQDILDGTKQAFCSTCTSDIKNRALTSIVN